MPNLDGIEATRLIVSRFPGTKVVALSIHAGKHLVENMLRAGAAGYILKESAPEELVNGIRTVIRGEVYLSSSVTGLVVSQYVEVLSQVQASGGPATLTKRERQLLRLIAEGGTAAQIASRLNIGEAAVASTKRRVIAKLGLSSAAELTEYAGAQKWFTGQGGIEETIRRAVTSDEREGDASVRKDEALGGSSLRSKLHPPPATVDRVPRHALLEDLGRHRSLPLTVVSAPAGYGKSTLISQWLESLAGPSAWVSLDENDNDLRRFLECIVAAVENLFPGALRNIRALLETPRLPPMPILCGQLLADMDQTDDAFVLVLDDYHRIHEEIVHNLVAGLLEHPPQTLHLALLTREDPPLPLNALRGRGRVHEISGPELRFTREETVAFPQNVLRKPVEEETAALIEERIEGWAAGLRMLAHFLRNPANTARVLSDLKSPLVPVMDYLVSEVLSRQPPAVADCLRKTSILDRFCAPLCDALCGLDGKPGEDGSDGATFLEWLQKHNLFVIALGAEQFWFRYHHLFQQILHSQLQARSSPEEVKALHSRASAWFAGCGLIDEALQHAIAAEAYDTATKLVEQNRQAVLNLDRCVDGGLKVRQVAA